MRSADVSSLLRIPLLFILAYTIFIKLNPVAVLILMLVLFVSDSIDGYLASSGKHSFLDFANYGLEEMHLVKRQKRVWKNIPKYAGYLDIAIDRLIEYVLWLTFILLSVLPWFVLAIVFVRNTIADYLVIGGGKGHREMQSAVGKIVSSPASRGGYGALKAINFGYLALVFISGWPVIIAYILTIIVVIFSLIRGAAEIYEALS